MKSPSMLHGTERVRSVLGTGQDESRSRDVSSHGLILWTPSTTLLTGCPEDGWDVLGGRWCMDACPQSSQSDCVVWSSTIANHAVDVHRHRPDSQRWHVLLASPKLCKTLHPL